MAQTPVPFVSVVIPARNAAGTLGRVLDAIHGQTYPADRREVLVIENGSSDATATIAAQHPASQLIRAPEAHTSYAARNIGLAHAKGEIIAFLDADCRPEPEWLTRSLQPLIQRTAELVAGPIRIPPEDQHRLLGVFDQAFYLTQDAYTREAYAGAGNLLVRRSAVDAIGGFDGTLISSGDYHFCLKAHAAGLRLVYVPEAVVYHPALRSLSSACRRWYRIGRGRAQTYYRHQLGDLHFRNPRRYRRALSFPWRAFARLHPIRPARLPQLLLLYYLQKACFVCGNVMESLRGVRRQRTTRQHPPPDRPTVHA